MKLSDLHFYSADATVIGIRADYLNKSNGQRYLIQSNPHTGVSLSIENDAFEFDLMVSNATSNDIEYTLPPGWTYDLFIIAVSFWTQGYAMGREETK